MSDVTRDSTRVFGENGDAYHRLRPRYPDALFTQIDTTLGPNHRHALELGAGTGIATSAVIDHGFQVTALEPDPGLIAVLTREPPGLEVLPLRFEDWQPQPETFDLVYSATAFHWFAPHLRIQKAALALKPGGYLAVFGYDHVAGGDRDFFEAIQRECYPRFMPGTSPDETLQEPDDLPIDTTEYTAEGLFEEPQVYRWVIEETYSRVDYLALLQTYSGHRWLTEDQRTGLLACIGDRIDALPNQTVRKAYLHELILARKPLFPSS